MDNALQTRLIANHGPLVALTDVSLSLVTNDEWKLEFKIRNNSNTSSSNLYLGFEGTNMPDIDIPDAPAIADSTISPLAESGIISVPLRQPVEYISLYEEFRTGEVIRKFSIAINSLVVDTNWTPNGIFPRSLGVYLNDNGNLPAVEVPFVE